MMIIIMLESDSTEYHSYQFMASGQVTDLILTFACCRRRHDF
jgi:hypothetical protein